MYKSDIVQINTHSFYIYRNKPVEKVIIFATPNPEHVAVTVDFLEMVGGEGSNAPKYFPVRQTVIENKYNE